MNVSDPKDIAKRKLAKKRQLAKDSRKARKVQKKSR